MTGSTSALVLSTATQTGGEGPPGKRANALLLPFFDPEQYAAIAVVHGLTPTASKAFDLAKQVIDDYRAVVWVTDPDLVAALTGTKVAKMKKALAPDGNKVLTFYSVATNRNNWSLGWQRMNTGEIEQKFGEAETDV